MSSIELRHVRKTYEGKTTVIEDMNLVIPDGSFTVLVGPSGCGKSTTLRMIAGLEDISDGDLLIDGVRMNDVDPGERDIAMVFQNYALYPTMSVRGNIEFGLINAKVPKAERARRIDEVARIVGLTDYLERKPSQLSGGQRQRVALARAMVKQPRVFLMDEPLSNLDAKLRTQMRTELIDLHQRLGTTFVYVTHDQTEAMTMARRIVLLNAGRVQQAGAPLELYDDPQNLFTAAFIGTPTINQLPGEKTGGAVRLLGAGTVPPALERAAAALPEGRFTLALRAEHLLPASPEDPQAIAVEPDYIEEMGAESIAWFRCGAGDDRRQVAVRLSREHAADFARIRALAPDWRRAFLFGASGDRLRGAEAAARSGEVLS